MSRDLIVPVSKHEILLAKVPRKASTVTNANGESMTIFNKNGVDLHTFFKDYQRQIFDNFCLYLLGERAVQDLKYDDFIGQLKTHGFSNVEINQLVFYSQDLQSFAYNTLSSSFYLPSDDGQRSIDPVGVKAASIINRIYRRPNGKLYYESSQSDFEVKGNDVDKDVDAFVTKNLKGKVVTIFELTDQGPVLVSVRASNSVLKQLLETPKNARVVLTDELVQLAEQEEQSHKDAYHEEYTPSPKRFYRSEKLNETQLGSITGIPMAVVDMGVDTYHRAREWTRSGWRLAGVDFKATVGLEDKEKLIDQMNEAINEFIGKKIPANYRAKHLDENIRQWMVANLGKLIFLYYSFQHKANGGQLDQPVFFKQYLDSEALDAMVDFVEGELIIRFERPLLLSTQNAVIPMSDLPKVSIQLTADITTEHPTAAQYQFSYVTPLNNYWSQQVHEERAIKAFGLAKESYVFAVNADEVKQLSQQLESGPDARITQAEYYQLELYLDLLGKSAAERLVYIEKTVEPLLEKIKEDMSPGLRKLKEQLKHEKNFVEMQKRVDAVEEALQKYLHEARSKFNLNKAKNNSGQYDLAQLDKSEKRDSKIYLAVLALGMIQRFRAYPSSMMPEYQALLKILHHVLERNNQKNGVAIKNRFNDFVCPALGEPMEVAIPSLPATLLHELTTFEKEQYEKYNDAKLTLIKPEALDPKQAMMRDFLNADGGIKTSQHIKDWAKALIEAETVDTVHSIAQHIELQKVGSGMLTSAFYGNDRENLASDANFLEILIDYAKAKVATIEKLRGLSIEDFDVYQQMVLIVTAFEKELDQALPYAADFFDAVCKVADGLKLQPPKDDSVALKVLPKEPPCADALTYAGLFKRKDSRELEPPAAGDTPLLNN